MDSYRKISGVVFAIVAIGHGARAAMGVPITMGATSVPIWISWAAFVFAGALSVWALRGQK